MMITALMDSGHFMTVQRLKSKTNAIHADALRMIKQKRNYDRKVEKGKKDKDTCCATRTLNIIRPSFKKIFFLQETQRLGNLTFKRQNITVKFNSLFL